MGNNPLSQVDADGHQFYRVSCSGGTAGQCGVGAYPGSEGIFSNEGMGPGMGCDAEGGEHCAPNMQESFYNSWLSTAQQQNGPGFWSRVGHGLSNLLHGHSWNHIKANVTYTETDSLNGSVVGGTGPNPIVTAGADALSVAGLVTGHPSWGKAGAGISTMNDPSVPNATMNAASFFPDAFGEAAGAEGLVYDYGQLLGWFTQKYVVTPMVNAIPGEEGNPVNVQGQQVQLPDDEGEGLGGPY